MSDAAADRADCAICFGTRACDDCANLPAQFSQAAAQSAPHASRADNRNSQRHRA